MSNSVESQQRETIEKVKELLENIAAEIGECRRILRGELNHE
jgi:predicted HicB family RNase H-like nuclease